MEPVCACCDWVACPLLAEARGAWVAVVTTLLSNAAPQARARPPGAGCCPAALRRLSISEAAGSALVRLHRGCDNDRFLAPLPFTRQQPSLAASLVSGEQYPFGLSACVSYR